jgi:hypothetical protein
MTKPCLVAKAYSLSFHSKLAGQYLIYATVEDITHTLQNRVDFTISSPEVMFEI